MSSTTSALIGSVSIHPRFEVSAPHEYLLLFPQTTPIENSISSLPRRQYGEIREDCRYGPKTSHDQESQELARMQGRVIFTADVHLSCMFLLVQVVLPFK